MDLKNKKGFITIYVMLAMMFFVVFVVTASVTASRKLKLQTEANTALYELYSKDVTHMVQDVNPIPIYTQSQFLQIAAWVRNPNRGIEYMYINDVLYKLDPAKYGNSESEKNYEFQLKTDLWFEEDTIDREDKDAYPYIMEQWIHLLLKKDNNTILLDVGQYNDDLEYQIYIVTDKKVVKTYGLQTIEIRTAKEFLLIGTGEMVNNIQYGSTDCIYQLQNNITITDSDISEIYDEFGYVLDFGYSRPEFAAILDGNNKIVEWQVQMPVNTSCDSAGFFKTNNGTIKDLTFTFKTDNTIVNINDGVTITGTGDTGFGLLTGINNGIINDCNIMISNRHTTEEINITGNNTTIKNFGVLVGLNKGTINESSNFTEIQGIVMNNIKATNLGIVAGLNSGTINNVNLTRCTINGNNNKVTNNVGTISGQNTNVINNITIDDCEMNSINASDSGYIGGVTGNNSGSTGCINLINIDNKLNITVNSGKYIGGIAGKTANTISGVTIKGNLNLNINDTIISSYDANGTKTNDTNISTDSWVGGIVGQSTSTIEKIKVEDNNNACINININPNGTDYGHAKFVGGIAAENNANIRNCIITGTINDKNNKSGSWHATGGIAGRSRGTNEKKIEFCYVNMKIEHYNNKNTLGTGGIVGVTGWNGAVGINNINDCAYVNEIVVSGSIAANGDDCGVGGIIGESWIGDSDTNNTLNLSNCYMNGKIPTNDPRAGAIIGINSNNNSKIATINLGTSNNKLYYNQAYRWLGYASKIGTNITLNYNAVAQSTSELQNSINTLKNTILNNINS